MTIEEIPFIRVPQFSDRDKAYTLRDPKLDPFYKYPVTLEAFEQVIEDKAKDPTPRDLLVKVLKAQYETLGSSPEVMRNIEALQAPNTFTVVTAHQPVLFTGPLYFVYKIASTIHLARSIQARYPKVKVVPVMIMGGEDHDFEEANHAHIFGRKLVWENEAGGSVGRMDTRSLSAVLEELLGMLGESDHAREMEKHLTEAFKGHERYGRAMQHFVNGFFKRYGLIVLSMDHPDLKRHFIPHMRRELLEQPSQDLVTGTQSDLEKEGFSAQAFARPINLFYLTGQSRERIEETEGVYQLTESEKTFSKEEILAEMEQHPERFSPNVVMRPLYQEALLPNLAYIGGGGELAYWLERKKQFAYFGINFPMLIRRNSVLWLDKNARKKMDKLGVELKDMLGDTEALVKEWVHARSEQELSLDEERAALQKIFDRIAQRAQAIDPTLVKTAKAEGAKQSKGLDQLEGKLIRAQKQRFDIELNQLRSLKDKLFPGGGLQERHDNFIPFFLKHGADYFEILIDHLDPLKTDFVVIHG